MKSSSLVFGSLMICLLLSSCGTARLTNSTPVGKSVAVSITPVEALTPTISSIPMCDSGKQLPLADAILTPEDMIAKYQSFESDHRWTGSADLTNDLLDGNSCTSDCAKRLWSPTKVSVVLIESNSPEEASSRVDETRKMFADLSEIKDRPYISDLGQNVWIAYDFAQQEFILLYSYGSIFVHIISHPAAGFDDFAGEFDLIYALGKAQNEKLCSSGHEP